MFERLYAERGLPNVLRTDNGPEFLSGDFVAWAETNGMVIQYIQPGKPNQNAYIERFNRMYREGLLSMYFLNNLSKVREAACWWRNDYNELRPHDSLGNMTLGEYMENEFSITGRLEFVSTGRDTNIN